jgi:protein ImuA
MRVIMASAAARQDREDLGADANPSPHDPLRALLHRAADRLHRVADTQVAETTDANDRPWTTGVDMIDACLPAEGISRSGLHEIEPLHATDMPSLTGFSFGLLSRLASCQPIIWCVTAHQVGDYGHLYAFGLERYGISPAQIILAKVNHPSMLHFALEEALKTEGVAAVIGEGPRPSFTGSRRLSLLARTHNRPCLLLGADKGNEQGSAALTRWQIAPVQGVEDPRDPFGPGLPTWRVALPRARSGRTMPRMEITEPENRKTAPYPWSIAWDEQTLCFRSTAVFRHGAVHQDLQQTGAEDFTLVGRNG